MKKGTFLMLVVAMVVGPVAAWAGRNGRVYVHVDLARRFALGSIQDARVSADDMQYIGCGLNMEDDQVELVCEAMNNVHDRLACRSDNPEIIKIGKAVSEFSYVFFACDANHRIISINVQNDSMWLR
ncbi:MAG: hypothetical protein JXO72_00815 [Vicinamibacteria bacterium]|nr:hypothetical protein [Vicinamibacteria bacterium]